jgi:hypothetical protein
METSLVISGLIRGESGSFAKSIQDVFSPDTTLNLLPEAQIKLEGFLFEVLFIIIALAKTFSPQPCMGDFLRAMTCLGLTFLDMVAIQDNKTCVEFLATLIKEIIAHIRTQISRKLVETSLFTSPHIVMVNHICFVIKSDFRVIYLYNSKFRNYSYVGPFAIDAPATGDCLPFSLIIAHSVYTNISNILSPREGFQADLLCFKRSESYSSLYYSMLSLRRNCHRIFRDLDAPFVHAQTVSYTVGGTKETKNGLTLTIGGENVIRTMTNRDALYINCDKIGGDIDFSPSNLERRDKVAKSELEIFLHVGPTPEFYPGHSMMYGFLYALKTPVALAVMHLLQSGFFRTEEIIRAGALPIVPKDQDPLCVPPLFHRPVVNAEGGKLGIMLDVTESWISGEPARVSNHLAIYHMGAHYQVPVPAWVFFLLIKHGFYVEEFKPLFSGRVSDFLNNYLFTPTTN